MGPLGAGAFLTAGPLARLQSGSAMGPKRTVRGGRGAASRGPVALEFALVLPVFLLLVSMVLTFGNAMWARLQMTNFAVSAVRLCTLSLPVSQAVVETCISRQFNDWQSRQPIRVCKLAPPQLQAFPYTLERPSDPARPNLFLEQVTLRCRYENIPFGGAIAWAASVPAFELTTRAAMPYMPTFTAGP